MSFQNGDVDKVLDLDGQVAVKVPHLDIQKQRVELIASFTPVACAIAFTFNTKC